MLTTDAGKDNILSSLVSQSVKKKKVHKSTIRSPNCCVCSEWIHLTSPPQLPRICYQFQTLLRLKWLSGLEWDPFILNIVWISFEISIQSASHKSYLPLWPNYSNTLVYQQICKIFIALQDNMQKHTINALHYYRVFFLKSSHVGNSHPCKLRVLCVQAVLVCPGEDSQPWPGTSRRPVSIRRDAGRRSSCSLRQKLVLALEEVQTKHYRAQRQTALLLGRGSHWDH